MRLVALISGGGRTLLNLQDRIESGELPCRVEVVVSSRSDAPGVSRARSRGLRVEVVDHRVLGESAAHAALDAVLAGAGADLVCCCGWLRWLRLRPSDRGRVVNIHPSLLPRFGGRGMYGDRVHGAVLSSGASYTGCTVHFVDEAYDHGPVILQRACRVEPGDDVSSLSARVFGLECAAYPAALCALASGRVRLEGDRAVWSGSSAGGVDQ